MTHPSSFRLHPFSIGTQVVALREVIGQAGRTLHPRGSVGVVVRSPRDLEHSYRVRFPDGVEESLRRERPNYELANSLLIKARRQALSEELP